MWPLCNIHRKWLRGSLHPQNCIRKDVFDQKDVDGEKGIKEGIGLDLAVKPDPVLILRFWSFILSRMSGFNSPFKKKSSVTCGQVFDLLVSVRFIHYCTYTPDLSTKWSTWGLII